MMLPTGAVRVCSTKPGRNFIARIGYLALRQGQLARKPPGRSEDIFRVLLAA